MHRAVLGFTLAALGAGIGVQYVASFGGGALVIVAQALVAIGLLVCAAGVAQRTRAGRLRVACGLALAAVGQSVFPLRRGLELSMGAAASATEAVGFVVAALFAAAAVRAPHKPVVGLDWGLAIVAMGNAMWLATNVFTTSWLWAPVNVLFIVGCLMVKVPGPVEEPVAAGDGADSTASSVAHPP